jgi:DNA-binding NarL/FixJ family response regulator
MKKHGCGQTVPRILIVEDNVAFRRFLREILQTNFPSMKVTEVGDGQEALRQADACTPDLIFIDVRLPGENGLRVTQKVKAAHPESVVAIITNYDLPEYRRAAYANGASYFLPKSTSTGDLLALVDEVLSEKHLHD